MKNDVMLALTRVSAVENLASAAMGSQTCVTTLIHTVVNLKHRMCTVLGRAISQSAAKLSVHGFELGFFYMEYVVSLVLLLVARAVAVNSTYAMCI